MIIYPLDVPPVFSLSQVTVRSRNMVATTAAPYTGREQVQEWTGAFWEMELTFPPLAPDQGDELAAFIESLNGKYGTFIFGLPTMRRPRGSAAIAPGSPIVFNSVQTGFRLAVQTTLGSVSGWLKQGDMIALGTPSNRALYRVTRDVDLIAGVGVVNIWPRLRQIPNPGDPVSIFDPTGRFRLSIDNPQHTVDESGIYGFDVLPIVEAVFAA